MRALRITGDKGLWRDDRGTRGVARTRVDGALVMEMEMEKQNKAAEGEGAGTFWVGLVSG
jgi:hypothetical protein